MAATAEQLARTLATDIAETQSRLDKWIDASKADLDLLEARHEKALQELEAERAALVARQGELQARLEEGTKLSKEEEEALAAIEADIAALKVREAELPKELAEARAKEGELRALLAGKKAELGQLTAKQGEYINDLTRGVVMYKHLGLDFERADNNKLRLIFTQLDAAHPAREFFFSVHIDEQDRYRVEECSPALDAGLVDRLVKEVNASNDFSAFVKQMRRAFKATVKPN